MSSYTPSSYLPQHQPTPPSYYTSATPPSYYTSATPPAPPPKPTSTEARGPPPPPLPGQNEPLELEGNQKHPNQHQYDHKHSAHELQEQQPRPPTIPTIEPGWLPPGIREKSTKDLETLLNDSALQKALLTNPQTTHPAIPASQAPLQELLESNLQLSNHLLTLEETLKVQRSETQSRLLALKAQEQQHRAKIEETENALQQFSPMALYQHLSASVGEQEGLVRGVEESWLDAEKSLGYGDGNGYNGGEGSGVASTAEVESFIRRVREARKVAFLRRERKGRWDEGRVGGWR